MTARSRIDDCLSTRNGHLFIEECDTIDLIQEFGSPLFVVSEDQIRRNVRRFQRAFQEGWPDGLVKVLPAAKANWISAVQRILADEGCGCDIYSPGELSVALDAGFDPQLISVNGVPKDEAHIYRSVREGVRITIDSLEEVDMIARAAQESSRTATVRLRLKPTISGFIDRTDFNASGLVPTDIAALVYKGVIPDDRWKEPYMPAEELREEINSGVRFYGWFEDDTLLGVMGIQPVKDTTLIRHSYVLTKYQRRGIGGELLKYLFSLAETPEILVGTWVDAIWAIRFYEKHGFKMVSQEEKDRLLRKYWDIPERQIATSVVLKLEK